MILSISDIKLHVVCPQLFHHRIISRRSTNTPMQALELGKLVHLALDRKSKGEPHWLELTVSDSEAAINDAEDTRGQVVATGVHTQLLHLLPHLENWQQPQTWETVASELELRTELGGHTLAGRLDVLVRWDGALWHLQYKTLGSSQPPHVFAEAQRTDWHESIYQRLVELHYPEEKIGGTILLIIRKLSKKALSENQSPFELHYLTRAAALVDKAWADVERRLDQITKELHWADTQPNEYLSGAEIPIEQTRSACAGRFGNSLCEYKPVCDGKISLDHPSYIDIEPRYT